MISTNLLKRSRNIPDNQDPFDRLMIAQAIVENLPVITADTVWKRYPIHILP